MEYVKLNEYKRKNKLNLNIKQSTKDMDLQTEISENPNTVVVLEPQCSGIKEQTVKKTRPVRSWSTGANERVDNALLQSSWPLGSATFQTVLKEIEQEKVAEQKLVEKTSHGECLEMKKNETENNNVVRTGRWKFASVRVLNRSKSQKELLKS